jgi:chromosome partitioning protein
LCLYESGTRLAAEVAGDVETFFREARQSVAAGGPTAAVLKPTGGPPVATSNPHRAARVFETRIRRNIRLAESPSHGQSIFAYAPTSPGAEDYRALGGEVLAYYAGRALIETSATAA